MTRIPSIALAALLAACTAPDSAPQDASAKVQTGSRREQSGTLFKQGLNHYRNSNYPAALPLFQQAAALGNARAEGYLGRIYLSNYAQKNHEQACIHFKAAAEQGDTASEFWLANCYDNGTGTAPDPVQAMRWYRAASRHGDETAALAKLAIGRIYEQGRGTTPDRAAAAEWYQKAMEATDDKSIKAQAQAALERLNAAAAGQPEK